MLEMSSVCISWSKKSLWKSWASQGAGEMKKLKKEDGYERCEQGA